MWRRHVQAQGRGGLSVRAYCTARGLREYSFYGWRRELARRDAAKPAAFVPVRVATEMPTPTPASQVEIVLPGEWRVRVVGPVDRQMLADVLSVLAAGGREEGVAC